MHSQTYEHTHARSHTQVCVCLRMRGSVVYLTAYISMCTRA